MRKLAAVLLLFGLAAVAMGQVPNFPQTVPANTVLGRLGVGPGPVQSIPFATLFAQQGGGSVTMEVPSGGTGAVSFTADLPLIGNGVGPIAQGTRSGNTTKFATSAGSLTAGHCVSIDGNGNYVDDGGVCGSGQPLMPPGGRLVANNAACGSISSIQQTDIAVVNVACYVPHISEYIPINGTNRTFSTTQATMAAAHQTTGNIYDIWGVYVSSTFRICYGGAAWGSTTASLASRSIAKSGAIYVNSGTISHCWDSTTDLGSFSAGTATYLGSVYANVDGGTQWMLSPNAATNGSANILGLYNAYNRVRVQTVERELTSNWTYSTATWRCTNNSCDNSITILDGLGLSQVELQFLMTIDTGDNMVNGGSTSICIDCSPADTPGEVIQANNQAGFDHTSQGQTLPAQGFMAGRIGLHVFTSLEIGGGGTATEWFGNTFSGMFAAMEN